MTNSTSPPLMGRHQTFDAALRAAAAQFPSQEAYVEGDERLSFADWVARAERLATALERHGVVPGDVVAIMLPPCIDYALCYAAGMLAGAVVTGINARLGPREVSAIIDKAGPKLVVVEDHAALPVTAHAPATMARSAIAATCGLPPLRRPAGRQRNDAAIIVWTSGTTGLPKGAWFDHSNLEAAVAMAGVMSAPFDRRLSGVPFSHAGYMTKVWEQVAFVMTYVITPSPWSAANMLKLMKDEHITAAPAVPTQWEKLLELLDRHPTELPALRNCAVATAPARPELVEAITRRFGCPLIVRYGMTESSSITGTRPEDSPDVLYRTVGRPQPGVELQVTDDTGKPVAQGEIGRIRVRAACVMRGYWNAPDATADALQPGGWLRTSDLGYMDPEGNLVLAGRTSDMYIRGGYNVYPLEVENVLSEHPGVAQVGVVGLATPVIGEIGVAFIVPVDAARPPTLDELRAWCRSRLADYKAPERIEILEALPLSAMMKVDKAALRALIGT